MTQTLGAQASVSGLGSKPSCVTYQHVTESSSLLWALFFSVKWASQHVFLRVAVWTAVMRCVYALSRVLRHGEPSTPGPFAAQTLNTASRIKSRSFNVVSRALCNLSLLRAQTRLAHCCLQSILQPGAAIFRLPTTCSRHQNRTQANSPNHSSSSSVTDSCSSRKSFRFPSVLLRPHLQP